MSQSQNVRKEFGSLLVGVSEVGNKQNYETLTVASTLDMTDSGKVFYLGTAGGFATTLPAVATSAGFHARFVVAVAPTTAYTVESAANDVHGVVGSADLVDAGTSANTSGTAVDIISFVASTAVVGDYVDVNCDGTFFFVSGLVADAGGVTLA